VRKKVLIVEDVKTTREGLRLLLSNRDHDVLEAVDGKEGLEIARSTPPDLIILDAELPELSGYDVYSLLKKDPALQRIPVLFLVADTDSFDMPTRSIPPAQFLVSKPFKAHDLMDRVARILS